MGSAGIKRWFGNGFKSKQEMEADEDNQFEVWNEELRVRGKKPIEREEPREKA